VHQLHDVHVIHVSYGTSAAVSWDVSVYLIFYLFFLLAPSFPSSCIVFALLCSLEHVYILIRFES
jgi:hypothetical protein